MGPALPPLERPEAAWEFLRRVHPSTRAKGEIYAAKGRVLNLECLSPGIAYQAIVQGSQPYTVELTLDDVNGLNGRCTCPVGRDCLHVYALVVVLLRQTQGRAPGVAPTIVRQPVALKPAPTGLAALATQALGRPLAPAEVRFARAVTSTYEATRAYKHIEPYRFEQMGLPLPVQGYEVTPAWPGWPTSEHEFWLFVAYTAACHRIKLPEFLRPITNLDAVAQRFAAHARQQEVNRWIEVFERERPEPATRVPTEPEAVALRLRITADETLLEIRRGAESSFTAPKRAQLDRFAAALGEGALRLDVESELLWTLWMGGLNPPRSDTWSDDDYDEDRWDPINRIVRNARLCPLIVGPDGQPLPRSEEALHWRLRDRADDAPEYILELVRADGRPVPELLRVLPGVPWLYLTLEGIFPGPVSPSWAQQEMARHEIPAAALESPAGLSALSALKVPLPPSLESRIDRVPLRVHLHCALARLYPGSPTETCSFKVQAVDPDGKIMESWNGSTWELRSKARSAGSRGSAGRIRVLDRSALGHVPRCLEPLPLKFDPYRREFSLKVTRKFGDELAAWLATLPPGVEAQLEGELASLAQAPIAGRVRLDVTEAAIDWFDLSVALEVTDTELTPAELKLLLDARGQHVRLPGKGWRRLEYQLTAEEDDALARLGLNPGDFTAEPQRLHALQLADTAARRFLPAERVEAVERRAQEIRTRVTPPLPAGVEATLRPYQFEGFHFLSYLSANRFGGILADDMGLGKTLQTLCWLLWLRAEAPTTPAPALVVCPKSVMDNWHAEAARFAPQLRVRTWSAAELATMPEHLKDADLHVLNYSQLRQVGDQLARTHWLAVVLDEGQYIKNPGALTSQTACRLRADHRLVLTGTPIENRLLDLWSLMAFAMPGILGNRTQFAKLYDRKDDPLARRRLAARVRPFLLRRTKGQVAQDLPARTEEDMYCEIEGAQLTLYRAELKRARQELLSLGSPEALAQHRFNFLTSLLRLRQICCHPGLIGSNLVAQSAKVEALLDLLEPLMQEGHKVLVFSQFVGLLDHLRPLLDQRKWRTFYLVGDTENRGALVQEFQQAPDAAVFLISLKAGGFGLNLTAASYVVLFDPWWNPAVENQAIDRTHRIGQQRPVIAYRLLVKQSIEEKIRTLQRQKGALAEDVLGEESFARSLTLDDFQFLLAD